MGDIPDDDDDDDEKEKNTYTGSQNTKGLDRQLSKKRTSDGNNNMESSREIKKLNSETEFKK